MDRWVLFLDSCRWSAAAKALGPLSFGGIGETPENLFHCHQVHGTAIIEAGNLLAPDAGHLLDADGVFTTKKNHTIGVKTADCLPVLVSGEGFVMALHCGWRGLTAGILARGLECAAPYGLKPEGLQFALGPCIQSAAFEVGPDVVNSIMRGAIDLDQSQAMLSLSKGREGDRWHLDMQVAAALSLANLGVPAENISGLRVCTRDHSAYHSYRRNGVHAGRNYSWIKITS